MIAAGLFPTYPFSGRAPRPRWCVQHRWPRKCRGKEYVENWLAWPTAFGTGTRSGGKQVGRPLFLPELCIEIVSTAVENAEQVFGMPVRLDRMEDYSVESVGSGFPIDVPPCLGSFAAIWLCWCLGNNWCEEFHQRAVDAPSVPRLGCRYYHKPEACGWHVWRQPQLRGISARSGSFSTQH